MPIDNIIAHIDSEILRLTQAKMLLAGAKGTTPPSVTPIARVKGTTDASKPTRKRRRLSAEARARIAEAQKKRWAAQKAKSK
jgi:hypothetical protein